MALRIKLLNASFHFKQALNGAEVEDVLHGEQQERYIAGIRIHAFDEIMSMLDYVSAGDTVVHEIAVMSEIADRQQNLALGKFCP
jgi:SepF-like predicted cell division protein (DUF552 family)